MACKGRCLRPKYCDPGVAELVGQVHWNLAVLVLEHDVHPKLDQVGRQLPVAVGGGQEQQGAASDAADGPMVTRGPAPPRTWGGIVFVYLCICVFVYSGPILSILR